MPGMPALIRQSPHAQYALGTVCGDEIISGLDETLSSAEYGGKKNKRRLPCSDSTYALTSFD